MLLSLIKCWLKCQFSMNTTLDISQAKLLPFKKFKFKLFIPSLVLKWDSNHEIFNENF
jgi:hypothetical protein